MKPRTKPKLHDLFPEMKPDAVRLARRLVEGCGLTT
jgi:hypothetical protein